MSDVERTGSVYTVDVTEQNTGPNGESTFNEATHFMESFEGAMRVAIHEVGGCPKVRTMGSGMLFVYEPHEDGEKHLRATVRERRVFAHR